MTTAYDRSIMGNIPYYNDFEEDKKFLQILFKPGFPVQARELSQLQSILQNQVERFGNHIFKNGSVVIGGAVNESNAAFVRIDSGSELSESTLNNMVGQIVRGTSGGVTTDARVVAVSDKPAGASFDNDPYQVLFLQYLTPGQYFENQRLSTVGSGNLGVSLTTLSGQIPDGVGTVSNFIAVNEGVYFTDGYFVKNDRQSYAAYNVSSDNFRDYSNPTTSVGFTVNKSIVSVDDDSSLRDPSFGFSNFNAPGADRYKVELTLDQKGLTGSEQAGFDIVNGENYFELVRVINGTTTRKIKYPDYAELEKTLARRTFDESGHYTVRPFELEVDSYQDTFGTVDTTRFGIKLSPGKAYVKGFEFETIALTKLEDTFPDGTIDQLARAETSFGAYVRLVNGTSTYNQKLTNVTDINGSRFGNSFLQGQKFFVYSTSAGGNLVKVGSFNLQNLFFEAGAEPAVRLYISNLVSTPVDNLNISNATLCSTGDIDDGESPSDTSFNSFTLVAGEDKIFTGSNKLLFQVGEGVQRLTNPVGFTMVRPFRVIANSNGEVTLSATDSTRKFVGSRGIVQGANVTPTYMIANGSESYVSRTEDYTINDSTGEMTVKIRNADGTLVATGTQVVVFAPLEGTSPNSIRRKVLSGDITQNYTTITDDGVIDLRVTDVKEVSSVIDGSGTDVTDRFILDDGQREDAYDFASLRIRPDSQQPIVSADNPIQVVYKRYNRTGSDGPFTADSYSSIATADVPTFNGKRLTNFIDYRPDRQIGTVPNSGDSYSYALASDGSCDPTTPPVDDVDVVTVRYGARIDSVVLTQDRQFLVLKGVPSAVDPKPPTVSPNDMELYRLIIPADAINPEDIRVVYIDNQRFTMRDIGEIEQTQESDSDAAYRRGLISQAVSRANSGDSSVPISLSGVFVDEFIGHANADVSRVNYNAAIDPIRNRLYPPFVSSSVGISAGAITYTGTVMPSEFDGVVMTQYTPNDFSKEINTQNTLERINPYGSVDYYGTLKLSPFCVNYWGTSRKARVFANSDGQLNNWELDITVRRNGQIAGRDRGFGTTWRAWELHWFGTRLEALENTSFVSPLDREYRGGDLQTAFVTRSLSKRLVRRVGDKILDFSIKPFIPETTFTALAEGLRPNSSVYVYLDDDLLDGPFTVGVTGAIQQDITIPADTFTVGQKRVTVLDDADGDITKATTSSDTFFYAERLLDTSLNGVSFTRPPVIRREASNTNALRFESYSDLFDSNNNTVINSLNPLHQIFTVNPDNYPNGTFLTDVELFFNEATEQETPVMVSIRPTVNGVPSKSIIIPFSEVTAAATAATRNTTDNTVSNGTTFTFSTPVYLPPGDYSLAVQTNDLSVSLYTNVTNVERAEFGPLYLPENNGSNVAYNDRRICVKMRSAAFGTDSGGNQVIDPAVTLPLLDTNFNTDLIYVSNSAENNSLFTNSVSLEAGAASQTLRQNASTETTRRNVVNGNLRFDLQFTGNYSTVIDTNQVSALSALVQMNGAGSFDGNEFANELALNDGNDNGSPAIARYYSKIVDISQREAADRLAVYVDGVFSESNQLLVFAKVRGTNSDNIEKERYYQMYPDGNTTLTSGVGVSSTLYEFYDPDNSEGGNPAPSNGQFPNQLFTQYLIKVIFNGELSEGQSIPYVDGLSALPLRDNIGILNFSRAIPTGTIVPYAGDGSPDETQWLPCDGRAIEKTGQYQSLATVIGSVYGSEGSNFVRLPNLNGRVPLGAGVVDGVTRTRGQTGGSHKLQGHNHLTTNGEGNAYPNAGFFDIWTDGPYTINGRRRSDHFGSGSSDAGRARLDYLFVDDGVDASGAELDGNLTEQMPPFTVVNYIIKT